jgi:hypothetical protein
MVGQPTPLRRLAHPFAAFEHEEAAAHHGRQVSAISQG